MANPLIKILTLTRGLAIASSGNLAANGDQPLRAMCE
jgi:hypothetical protein